MRKVWIRSLALSLGLTMTSAQAQQSVWRAPQAHPGGTSTSPVALGKPIAIAISKPVATAGSIPAAVAARPAPSASLGRPVPIARTPVRDEQVKHVSFSPSHSRRAPVVRGTAPEVIQHKPMPIGPNTDPSAAGMHHWRRPDEVVATNVSRNGEGTNTAAPAGAGAILPTPTVQNPIVPIPGGSAPGVAMTPGVTSPGVGPVLEGGPFPQPKVVSGPGGVVCPEGCCCEPCVGGICCDTGCCGGPGWFKQMLGGCWGNCNHGGSRFLVGAEYLMWWFKGDKTPPLLQSTPSNDPNGPILGNPNATILYGGQALGEEGRSGFRVYGVWWFGDDCPWGIDGGGFYVAGDDFFQIFSGGEPALGRPIFNTFTNLPDAEVVASLGQIAGSFDARRTSRLWGYDLNLRRNICCRDWCTFDGLFGFRQVGLDESLTLTENLTAVANILDPMTQDVVIPIGTRFSIQDRFGTMNRFYGAQLGFDAQFRYGNLTLGLRTKVGLGVTEQTVDINGNTTLVQTNGQAPTAPGGLLALQTNIDRRSQKMFGVIPEVGVTLGYDLTDWFRIFAGYNFLYWNSVVRPGEQINLNVNSSFVPFRGTPTGAPQPQHDFQVSDFFAHGVSLGMEFRF